MYRIFVLVLSLHSPPFPENDTGRSEQPCRIQLNRCPSLRRYCECKFGLKTMELGCKHEVAYFTCEEEVRAD